MFSLHIAIVYPKIPKNMFHIETSDLICKTNQLTGFCMARIFTEMYFRADFSWAH